ncbi:hypothetical protein NFI95_06185 [Acetobacteraceae bacterium KSS8]|uniref:Uncharacterized protein n=1 Tax=Endosaccharibacter trunci TaxID=2812733 RepID=A0ABT1W5L7_9PROT|nr:hypothetical protein [Acetobacteraceae bacterium KSS8]
MIAARLLPLFLLAGCAGGAVKQAGETDVACIHRLYDFPNRAVAFQNAVSECAGGRKPDLTGDKPFQIQASTDNIPFVARDKAGAPGLVVTGSRLPVPTDQPLPPQQQIR